MIFDANCPAPVVAKTSGVKQLFDIYIIRCKEVKVNFPIAT